MERREREREEDRKNAGNQIREMKERGVKRERERVRNPTRTIKNEAMEGKKRKRYS